VNILFVLDRRVNAGSIHAVAGYQRAADRCGHRIALFGAADPQCPSLRTSVDVESFDHVVFIFESTLNWLSGLKLLQLLNRVPRARRAILDADGMYNDVVAVDGYDRNHADDESQRRWTAAFDALTDRIFQPTLQPLSPKVRPLLFYGYDAAAEWAGPQPAKTWDLLHLGHNWWRWRQVGGTLLPAIARVRPYVAGICFMGSWWDEVPSWASAMNLDAAISCNPEWMRRLHVQILPAVPFAEVISTMSAARINVMTQRPLFQRLRFVTSKYFELLCADTIPLVMVPPDLAEEVYGAAGRELAVCHHIEQTLLDALERPDRYRDAVEAVRRHVQIHHSYQRRVEELVEALECERPQFERALAL